MPRPAASPAPADYDAFAWFYDRYWNQEFHSLAFPLLERIWLPRVPAGARILDVCCGTGYLAGLLTSRGYDVTGVDVSAEMIAHARRHAPQAAFEVADVRRFRAPAKFAAAVSTFDSLNHLLTTDALGKAIGQIAAALEAGGVLAFDILLEDAYKTNWGENFALVRDDHVLTITGSGFDLRNRLAQCRITMFRRIAGEWQRWDTTVLERCHTRAEIDAALAAAGFGDVTVYDARDLGMDGALGVGRTFYVAALSTAP